MFSECGVYSHERHPNANQLRGGYTGYSENPPPLKGTIMRKLSPNQLKAIEIASVSVLGIIAIKQTNKVAKLQKALVKTTAQKDFYADLSVRTTSMMNLPQMLHLVDEAVNDMRFRNILRTNGM